MDDTISSQIEKYRKIYNKIIAKYGSCDKIFFSNVLGYPKAFLIQNMFPVTQEYIDVEYINSLVPVRVRKDIENKIISNSKLILALHRQGKPVTWPNIDYIYKELTGNDL